MNRIYDWLFPLPRTHTGMLLGNAISGAMIWGGGNVLNVTLNRADFWDHRGGKPWTAAMNYRAIRRMLEAGDEAGLRGAFESVAPPPGSPRKPTMLPLGRLELRLPAGCLLRCGRLHLATGKAVVELTDAAGKLRRLSLEMSARKPVLAIDLPAGLAVEIERVPAWKYVGEHLQAMSFKEPALFDSPRLTGWVQERPADEPLCLGYRRAGRQVWAALVYGSDADAARTQAAKLVDATARAGLAGLRRDNARWWGDYWQHAPRLDLPNPKLQFAYDYGMYKFAGLTAPHGVPANLQGPWFEEYQMPPWSGDYHFNINVQECYWPAYPGNQLQHLRPILDLVWSWRDRLRENARLFVGIDDGYLLPHAVDDRGTCMGGFWTGTVDHGCTAWVAKMMYDYWLYGGDKRYLRQVAYPFMCGAMRVYEQMLDRLPPAPAPGLTPGPAPGSAPESAPAAARDPIENELFVLPVSVSPEYRGAALNAWGQNASFQLAAIHWLIEALQRASQVLGLEPRPIWAEIQRGLPRACVESPPPYNCPKIMLWRGTDLEESHRHHSHLAGFHPFDVLDLRDPAWRAAADASFRWWMRQGMGQWTGWCVPWAAMLAARIGIPEMVESLLEHWEEVFTNEGHGTLHDPLTWTRVLLPAQKQARRSSVAGGFGRGGDGEIMQIEAGMAAATAVMDALVHTRRGIHYVFPGVPPKWERADFQGIRTEGGFLVGAQRRDGRTTRVEVSSAVGGVFRVANPWTGEPVAVTMNGRTAVRTGDLIEVRLPRGKKAVLRPG